MACCPFHEDHHPSMKLDERFHCFGCGADGDVIDFAARLFRLPVKEAAERLAADFGIAPGIPTRLLRQERKVLPKSVVRCCWRWKRCCTGKSA
jgi:DNA primase